MQKKLLLIYNPGAGDRSFKDNLDACIGVLQKNGYLVSIVRLDALKIEDYMTSNYKPVYDAIIMAGGDGTLCRVINSLMRRHEELQAGQLPTLGVIPAGTANDFASFLNMPKSPTQCCNKFVPDTISKIDLGRMNDQYFINVGAGGVLTNVSQNTDKMLKDTIGKLAYYMKGIEQLPHSKPFELKITHSGGVIQDKFYFFMALNGGQAGGFSKLAPEASVGDGLLDFVAVKAAPLTDLAVLSVKIVTGNHLDDSNIVYFKDNHIKVELVGNHETPFETDIDGEVGPLMPLDIQILPLALQFFTGWGN